MTTLVDDRWKKALALLAIAALVAPRLGVSLQSAGGTQSTDFSTQDLVRYSAEADAALEAEAQTLRSPDWGYRFDVGARVVVPAAYTGATRSSFSQYGAPAGSTGTVVEVDSRGRITVQWDSGPRSGGTFHFGTGEHMGEYIEPAPGETGFDYLDENGQVLSIHVVKGLKATAQIYAAQSQAFGDYLGRLADQDPGWRLAFAAGLREAAQQIQLASNEMEVRRERAQRPHPIGGTDQSRYEELMRQIRALEATRDPDSLAEAERLRERITPDRNQHAAFLEDQQTYFDLLNENPVLGLIRDEEPLWRALDPFGERTDFWTWPPGARSRLQAEPVSPTVNNAEALVGLVDEYVTANRDAFWQRAEDVAADTTLQGHWRFGTNAFSEQHRIFVAQAQVPGSPLAGQLISEMTTVVGASASGAALNRAGQDFGLAVLATAVVLIPVVGPLLSLGIASIIVVRDGEDLVVAYLDEQETREVGAVTGYHHILTAEERTADAGKTLAVSVAGLGAEALFLRSALAAARNVRHVRGRPAAPPASADDAARSAAAGGANDVDVSAPTLIEPPPAGAVTPDAAPPAGAVTADASAAAAASATPRSVGAIEEIIAGAREQAAKYGIDLEKVERHIPRATGPARNRLEENLRSEAQQYLREIAELDELKALAVREGVPPVEVEAAAQRAVRNANTGDGDVNAFTNLRGELAVESVNRRGLTILVEPKTGAFDPLDAFRAYSPRVEAANLRRADAVPMLSVSTRVLIEARAVRNGTSAGIEFTAEELNLLRQLEAEGDGIFRWYEFTPHDGLQRIFRDSFLNDLRTLFPNGVSQPRATSSAAARSANGVDVSAPTPIEAPPAGAVTPGAPAAAAASTTPRSAGTIDEMIARAQQQAAKHGIDPGGVEVWIPLARRLGPSLRSAQEVLGEIAGLDELKALAVRQGVSPVEVEAAFTRAVRRFAGDPNAFTELRGELAVMSMNRRGLTILVEPQTGAFDPMDAFRDYSPAVEAANLRRADAVPMVRVGTRVLIEARAVRNGTSAGIEFTAEELNLLRQLEAEGDAVLNWMEFTPPRQRGDGLQKVFRDDFLNDLRTLFPDGVHQPPSTSSAAPAFGAGAGAAVLPFAAPEPSGADDIGANDDLGAVPDAAAASTAADTAVVDAAGAGFDPLEAFGTLLITPYGELSVRPFASAVSYPGAFAADGSIMLFEPGTSFGMPASPFTCSAPDPADGGRVTCVGVTVDPPIFIAPGPFVVPTTNIERQPDGTVAYGGVDFGGLGTQGEPTGPFRPFPQPAGDGLLAGAGGGGSADGTLIGVGGFGAGGIPPGPLSGWGESETFFGEPVSGTLTTDSSMSSTGGFNINVLDNPQYLTTAFDATGTRATGIQMMVVDTSEIFADGFESGDTSSWTDSPRQDGRLQQPASGPRATLRSAWGMFQRWVTPTAPAVSLSAHRTMAWPSGSSSRRIALSPVAGQTSGSQPAGDEPRLETLITSLGVSTGEALTMRIVNLGPIPVELTGDGLVVQPLEDIAKEQLDRAIANLAAKNPLTMNVEAYCLEMLRLPPTLDTVFQVASAELQKQFEPARRILGASRQLFEAGQLSPDSDPLEYFHSIRQWAIWSDEQGFDEASFSDAFVNHTRRNLEAEGTAWQDAFETVLRGALPSRWSDIGQVLQAATTQ